MTAEPDAIRYRRIRAPREDGQALIEPPLFAALEQLKSPTASLTLRDWGDCCGKSLADLSREARGELLHLATHYTAQYRNVDPNWARGDAEQPIVMAGHQPTLFHPGVWFKNFALSSLATQAKCPAVNLVVDNDTLRAASIRVPTGTVDAPIYENVPFDDASAEVPFEERSLLQSETYDSFAKRVQALFQPLLAGGPLSTYTPLVNRFWRIAREVRRRHDPRTSLGWLLAEARHQLEAEFGLSTLELPLSQACDMASFRWFAVYLLAELPRLAADYNAMLAEYRLVNHVRSRSHPVPDLARDDDWLEAPFWIWTAENPRRRHLFARRRSQTIEISDRVGLRESLPLGADGDAAPAVEQLARLRDRGIKIRPRALVTTMFSRLLAGDVFLHGIGGAKYDELTDAIVRRFFDLEPPPFLTVTATLQLPIARPKLSPDDLRQSQQRLREVGFHPERFAREADLAKRAELEALAQRKQQLLDELPRLREQGESRKAWHRELATLNQTMAGLLSGFRARLAAEQPQLADQLSAAQRLGSREYSFVLFPEETLPEQLQRLARLE